jgi:hypothetical protein
MNEVFTASLMPFECFGLWRRFYWYLGTDVSGEHTPSILSMVVNGLKYDMMSYPRMLVFVFTLTLRSQQGSLLDTAMILRVP